MNLYIVCGVCVCVCGGVGLCVVCVCVVDGSGQRVWLILRIEISEYTSVPPFYRLTTSVRYRVRRVSENGMAHNRSSSGCARFDLPVVCRPV